MAEFQRPNLPNEVKTLVFCPLCITMSLWSLMRSLGQLADRSLLYQLLVMQGLASKPGELISLHRLLHVEARVKFRSTPGHGSAETPGYRVLHIPPAGSVWRREEGPTALRWGLSTSDGLGVFYPSVALLSFVTAQTPVRGHSLPWASTISCQISLSYTNLWWSMTTALAPCGQLW